MKVEHLAGLRWPGFALTALLAEPLVPVALGPDWEGAATALRILSLGGLALPFTKMGMKLFVALDALGSVRASRPSTSSEASR